MPSHGFAMDWILKSTIKTQSLEQSSTVASRFFMYPDLTFWTGTPYYSFGRKYSMAVIKSLIRYAIAHTARLLESQHFDADC